MQLSNQDDVDPISLESIALLSAEGRVFHVTNPHTKIRTACDADAWLTHLTGGGRSRADPCTRLPLEASEVWECFANCMQNLQEPDKDERVRACLSGEVRGDVTDGTIRLFPRSPLVNMRVQGIQEDRLPTGTEKKFVVRYSLVDSRDGGQELHPPVTVAVECPVAFRLAVM